jgi:hypothetical protein
MIVESVSDIYKRLRAAGVERPASAAQAEHHRQCREYQREAEDRILAEYLALPVDAIGWRADWLRDLGGSIQDHRAAGNYIRG